MDLVGFECPLMGEKKLLYEKENLDSVLESISAWSSAPVLNLKLWILKMRAPRQNIFEIWNLAFQNEKIVGENMSPTLIGQSYLKSEMFWPPPKMHNARGSH